MSGRLADRLTGALRTGKPTVESPGERWEAGDLDALSGRVTEALTRRGLNPHEPVHVVTANRAADLGAMLGIWRAGGVAVPVHLSTPPPARDVLQTSTGARFAVDGGSVAAIGDAPPPDRPLLREAALVVFTSGSTGRPKGVVLGHERLSGKLDVLARLLSPGARDTVLLPLQLTFIFGIWVSLLTILGGGRLRLMPRFAPDAAWEALGDGATVLAAVPTMLRSLAASPPGRSGAPTVLTGGEPLGERLAASVLATLPGARLFDLYGLTETGSCDFRLAPADQPDGLGSIGAPTDGVGFRIVDEGRPVAAEGAAGELQIRTPYGMLGYLDDPGLTAASFGGGFFKTGDLARVRGDGRVELVGRSKEMISRGGAKVAPLELDRLFASHPDVEAALSAGVPDESLGETIHVVVVPRRGAALDAQALRAWAAERVERHKVPDSVHVGDRLPVGLTGKADRAAVVGLARKARPE